MFFHRKQRMFPVKVEVPGAVGSGSSNEPGLCRVRLARGVCKESILKRVAMTVFVFGLLSATGTLAQTTPGGATTSADPSASTTRTGLPPAQSGARPTPQGMQMDRAGIAQSPSAVPQARNTPSDPHTGRNTATGSATTPGGASNDQ